MSVESMKEMRISRKVLLGKATALRCFIDKIIVVEYGIFKITA